MEVVVLKGLIINRLDDRHGNYRGVSGNAVQQRLQPSCEQLLNINDWEWLGLTD